MWKGVEGVFAHSFFKHLRARGRLGRGAESERTPSGEPAAGGTTRPRDHDLSWYQEWETTAPPRCPKHLGTFYYVSEHKKISVQAGLPQNADDWQVGRARERSPTRTPP